MEILNIPINRRIKQSEARCVLELLGFRGVHDFADISAISHQTVAELLDMRKANSKGKHHYNIIQVHEALHTAYNEARKDLSPHARRFILAWARIWRKGVLKKIMRIEGKMIPDASKAVRRDRERKRREVLLALQTAFLSLEWK